MSYAYDPDWEDDGYGDYDEEYDEYDEVPAAKVDRMGSDLLRPGPTPPAWQPAPPGLTPLCLPALSSLRRGQPPRAKRQPRRRPRLQVPPSSPVCCVTRPPNARTARHSPVVCLCWLDQLHQLHARHPDHDRTVSSQHLHPCHRALHAWSPGPAPRAPAPPRTSPATTRSRVPPLQPRRTLQLQLPSSNPSP